MLLYVTMTIWTPFLIYFWISVAALCVAPFVFNPHQFSFPDFIIDYRWVYWTHIFRFQTNVHMQGIFTLDVPWQFSLSQQFVDRLLPVISYHDHWV